MKKRKMSMIVGICGLMVLSNACSSKSEKKELTILAAASMKHALEELKMSYPDKNVVINYSFGASGTLQTQIEQGAPADIFISAASKQMDALEEKNKIESESRVILLKNELVLVAAIDDKSITSIDDLTNNTIKKIALGDFRSVPAGQYAQQAFTYLKIIDKIEEKAVFGSDVRAVLNWVETKQADCGVVYGSDAKTSKKVRIVANFPAASHKEIVYPMAIINGSKETAAAKDFMKYLQSDTAKNVFKKNGFQV